MGKPSTHLNRQKPKRPNRTSTVLKTCCAPQILAELCELAGTDVAAEISSLLRSGDFKGVVGLEIDPNTYESPEAFRWDYLLTSLMSKYPEWDIGVDRELVAIGKFVDSEVSCREVNLDLGRRLRSTKINGVSMQAVFLTAQHKISRLLGPLDLDQLARDFEWGPGATVSLPRRYSDAYYKFGTRPTASHNLRPIAELLETWFGDGVWQFKTDYTIGSKGTTVPKNAKSDRFIAIEPDLNLFVQKAIGKQMRQALRKVGLLTPKAQEEHARLALSASLDESLATIDLSAASDSIALALCRELLPPDWLTWIEYTRSPVCVLPTVGLEVELQKVSSMGNGYTFELETLLFWSLSSALTDLLGENGHLCSVYGDDIICPTKAADPIIELLAQCGFKTNASKTFTKGPFRESCGMHAFRGIDVTPFFVREKVLTKNRLYWLANSLREWASSSGNVGDPRVKPLYDRVVDLLPERMRLPIPVTHGKSCGLVIDLDEAMTHKVVRFDQIGHYWTFLFSSEKSKKGDPQDQQRLAKSLYVLNKKYGERDPLLQPSCESMDPEMGSWMIGTIPKGTVQVVRRGVSSGWCGYGPWAV